MVHTWLAPFTICTLTFGTVVGPLDSLTSRVESTAAGFLDTTGSGLQYQWSWRKQFSSRRCWWWPAAQVSGSLASHTAMRGNTCLSRANSGTGGVSSALAGAHSGISSRPGHIGGGGAEVACPALGTLSSTPGLHVRNTGFIAVACCCHDVLQRSQVGGGL